MKDFKPNIKACALFNRVQAIRIWDSKQWSYDYGAETARQMFKKVFAKDINRVYYEPLGAGSGTVICLNDSIDSANQFHLYYGHSERGEELQAEQITKYLKWKKQEKKFLNKLKATAIFKNFKSVRTLWIWEWECDYLHNETESRKIFDKVLLCDIINVESDLDSLAETRIFLDAPIDGAKIFILKYRLTDKGSRLQSEQIAQYMEWKKQTNP